MPAKKKKKLVARKKILKKKVIGKKLLKKSPAKKKTIKKKPAPRKKLALKKKPVLEKIQGDIVGTVTHYFPKVRAAVVKLKAPLNVGEMVRIKGHTTDLKQLVNSLQMDHVPVNIAKKGQEIGLLVNSRVRQRDIVYKI